MVELVLVVKGNTFVMAKQGNMDSDMLLINNRQKDITRLAHECPSSYRGQEGH